MPSDDIPNGVVTFKSIKDIANKLRGTGDIIDYLINDGFTINCNDYYLNTLFLRKEGESFFVKVQSPNFGEQIVSNSSCVVLVKNYLAVFLIQASVNSLISAIEMTKDFPIKFEEYLNLMYDEKLDSLIYNFDSERKIPIIRPHQIYLYADTEKDIESIKFSNFDYDKLLVNKVKCKDEICSIPELIKKLEEQICYSDE